MFQESLVLFFSVIHLQGGAVHPTIVFPLLNSWVSILVGDQFCGGGGGGIPAAARAAVSMGASIQQS